MQNKFKLIIALIIPQLAGLLGSIFTSSAIPTWYSTLIKPSISPPNWIFAPVWISLYLLMGISLFLVWKKGFKDKKAVTFFSIQLILNTFWSIIFFGLNSILFAFIEIVILWIFILLTIIYFYRISKIASYLLIPYILWVSFAAILNYLIFILN